MRFRGPDHFNKILLSVQVPHSRPACSLGVSLPQVSQGRLQNNTMPDIPVGAQIFDLAFHPTHPTVYTALLNGEIKAFTYDEQGGYEPKFTVQTSKKSCRGLTMSEDGAQLYAVGKGKAFQWVLNSNLETETCVESCTPLQYN